MCSPKYLSRRKEKELSDWFIYGSGRTGLTKFISPFQNSRQNLSLPNFQFVKLGRTDTQQNIC